MWVDDQSVCHTVGLPEPTVLMSDAFRESLDRLLAEHMEEVAEVIAAEEARFFEEQALVSVSLAEEREFMGTPPPAMLVTEALANVNDLRSLIHEINRRWRLDALTALDDYIS